METIVAGYILGIVLMGSGWAINRIARRASSGGLSRNAIAGIRTTATMESDDAWTAAHIRAEAPTVVGGWLCVASGIACLAIAVLLTLGKMERSMGDPLLLTFTTTGTVALLGLGGYGCLVGHRAAKIVIERSTNSHP